MLSGSDHKVVYANGRSCRVLLRLSAGRPTREAAWGSTEIQVRLSEKHALRSSAPIECYAPSRESSLRGQQYHIFGIVRHRGYVNMYEYITRFTLLLKCFERNATGSRNTNMLHNQERQDTIKLGMFRKSDNRLQCEMTTLELRLHDGLILMK